MLLFCKISESEIQLSNPILQKFTDFFHIVDCCSLNSSKRAVFHNSLLNSRAGQVALLVGNEKKTFG